MQYIEELSKQRGEIKEDDINGTIVEDKITRGKFKNWIEFIMKQKVPESAKNKKIYKYKGKTYFDWFKEKIQKNESLLKMYTNPKKSKDIKFEDSKRRHKLAETLLLLFKNMYKGIAPKKEEENMKNDNTSIFKDTKNKMSYDGEELKAMKKNIETFLNGVKYHEDHEYSTDEEF